MFSGPSYWKALTRLDGLLLRLKNPGFWPTAEVWSCPTAVCGGAAKGQMGGSMGLKAGNGCKTGVHLCIYALFSVKCFLSTNWSQGFPHAASGACESSRCRFDPWVRKIPWRRAWQPISVSLPAWKIPWSAEPGGLQTIGLQRVGHNWSDFSMHT